MIVFNDMKYAKNDKEFTDSLFVSGGTCNGFYKKYKRKIHIYNMQHELIACIVNNGYGERFIVSARVHDNKPRYMFSTMDEDKGYLGLSEVGYMDTIKECERVIEEY